ncbi:putative ribonuclease inhibitor-like [Triplophysa rosa]|uniref:Ribonuclease inhibitor-like n=1 Tax=Triplophysa rosa TaxID=992332 RepID=A0A9W7T5H7_TRIRA|nr:putative ribonuclease inhibitor-like [Triplophysa rosa]
MLGLSECSITEEGYRCLSEAVRSNPSHLISLDLSGNDPGPSGVKLIYDLLEDTNCALNTVRLRSCGFSKECCADLSSALNSNPSHLRHLNLSKNNLGTSGVNKLSDLLKNPQCKLKTLVLCGCSLTEKHCARLISALCSNPSHLTHLNLSGNNLGTSGVNKLSDLLKNPQCKLKTLVLRSCEKHCARLISALCSNPSHLTHLNLSGNNLGTSGVNKLSDLLKNPQCKLKTLVLRSCGFSKECCAALSSALNSNPSHLTHLNLSGNNLGTSGVNKLSDLLKNPQCKLKTLTEWL